MKLTQLTLLWHEGSASKRKKLNKELWEASYGNPALFTFDFDHASLNMSRSKDYWGRGDIALVGPKVPR